MCLIVNLILSLSLVRYKLVSSCVSEPVADYLLLCDVVKRKKRKMGMYNLVPKKKTRVLKQPEKVGP